MKDIIEKYKKGELTVNELVYNSSFCMNIRDEILMEWNDVVRLNLSDNCLDAAKVLKCLQLDKEIAAMEKQPEYEYVKIELGEIGEWVDGSWCYASNLYFEWSGSNIVPISEVSAIDLIKNPHKLVQQVELTPERKREKEVEELAKTMWMSDPKSVAKDFESDLIIEYRVAYRKMAEAALEWMEQKGEQ